jgi:Flp pilus assembly protein TadD
MAAQLPPDAEKRQQELYAAVLLLDPEQLEARYNVASRLLAQGRFEQAASDFRFLVERSPQVTLGMIGLAKAQVELGQVQEARLMVARVLRLTPLDPDALALHARLNGR